MSGAVDVSIVIVSYNSSDLLMLTLASVRRAMVGLEAEVFVVDNDSPDDSVARVRSEAPWAHLMEMGFNAGFSKANNAALGLCRGRVVMLLNPDTVICADTLRRIVEHYDANPSSGAVGVRMINGRGRFLGESKRGYADIPASVFKLTGLWRLAPRSRVLNAYYLGQYGEEDVCHAPILSGACMAFPHRLMDEVGGLDEGYFMYSEDIDYSWRMDKASGGGNVYRGDVSIVHFKGQSTPRRKRFIDSFYDSMLRFAVRYEFPRHGAVVNALTAVGVKVAYLFALARCVVMRSLEGKRVFEPPRNVVVFSDSDVNELKSRLAGGGMAVKTMTYGQMAQCRELPDAVLFSLDGDVGRAIDFMRHHRQGRCLFGFYNGDNGDALVYFNNRCHKL